MAAWGRRTGTLGALVITFAAAVAAAVPADAAPPEGRGRCSGFRPTIAGTPGADVIRGTNQADVISAGAGDDRIEGLGLHDFICGGRGNDVIDAGSGADWIRGGAGDDELSGGDDDDNVVGLGGDDSADGGPGKDTCFAESGRDCEAQLSGTLHLAFPPPPGGTIVAGDDRVTRFQGDISNAGPSPALSTYAVIDLPAESEFVRSQSAPACSEDAAHQLTCEGGAIRVWGVTSFGIALRFPQCPQPGTTFTMNGLVDDLYTEPISFGPYDGRINGTFTTQPAPSCPP
jgi:Ca2+-binding RTX toxin-like protein